MKMSKFAEKFDMDADEIVELLTNNGYLKKNGDPSKKGEDLLDDDENVSDARALSKIVEDLLDDEDEDEDDDDDSDDDEDEEDDSDDEDSDDNDEDDDEIDFETIKNTIEDFDFEWDDLMSLSHTLIDKIDGYKNSSEDDEDSDEDEDEDEDPNAPGTYKGWKISKEGIKIIAKNGKKSLTTSLKGNIREKIDAEMKKKNK